MAEKKLKDLSGDGKVTQKDVLIGRGVIEAKKGGQVKKKKLDIKKAIKKPGSLRKSLGVKKGQKIPLKKLNKAAKAPGKLGQRARFAKTLSKLRKK